MKIQFTVTVEVERESGKFAPRDEILDEIREWLEAADQGEISGIGSDGESIYNTTEWAVESS